MTPAQYVISLFKGVRATARQIGRAPSSVSKWNKPKSQSGSEGQIPTSVRLLILEKAEQLGLDITSQDLDFGRDIAD